MKLFIKNVHSLKLSPWNGDRWLKTKWDSTMGDTKEPFAKNGKS